MLAILVLLALNGLANGENCCFRNKGTCIDVATCSACCQVGSSCNGYSCVGGCGSTGGTGPNCGKRDLNEVAKPKACVCLLWSSACGRKRDLNEAARPLGCVCLAWNFGCEGK